MTRARRDRGADRRGRTAVETAIVINLLVVLLLGVFEYGRLIMVRQLMDNAAREGARFAVVNTSTTSSVTTAQIQAQAQTFLAGQSFNNLNIQVFETNSTTGANIGAWNASPFGTNIAVQIDLDFVPIMPIFGGLPGAVHLTAKSMMASEAN